MIEEIEIKTETCSSCGWKVPVDPETKMCIACIRVEQMMSNLDCKQPQESSEKISA